MQSKIKLHINQQEVETEADPETPLLYVLRNDLGLVGAKFGCGLEQCSSCKVLIDGTSVPSCQLPIKQLENVSITTVEGLAEGDELHPLQEAFVEEQAIQCGYCVSGMLIAVQGLLNRVRHPTDDQIREALADHICRCGVYERVRRAIKMRIGQPQWEPIYEVKTAVPLSDKLSTPSSPSLGWNQQLDSWIRIDTEKTITIFTGKVEIGQGILTAVSQIAAEELDVAFDRIRVETADTAHAPNEGITAGSMSMQMSGNAIRQAASEARWHLLKLAFEELEAECGLEELEVTDGLISDPISNRQITYWDLLGGKQFGLEISSSSAAKRPADYSIVGQPIPRSDLVAKVKGEACFVQDMTLPNMVHARVVRPPGYDAKLISVDETAVLQQAGVIDVVRNGSFLAVVAEREEQAVWARDRLQETAVWQNNTAFPNQESLYDELQSQEAETRLVEDGVALKEDVTPFIEPENMMTTTYLRPYQMHGSLAPSAAVALWQDEQLTIWSHTQGIFFLQDSVSEVTGIAPEKIRVIHREGSGCYGHNGADDVALDAVLVALTLPGRPVSLKWMREDEHLWEPYGPAMAVKVGATVDSSGLVAHWQMDSWSYPHTSRPRRMGGGQSRLLASWYLEEPFEKPEAEFLFGQHFGSYRNSDPLYAFPQKRIVSHLVKQTPLRTSAMRGLGAYANIFAIESFMDELAFNAGVDPVSYRLQQLRDERARAVIETAVAKANWTPRSEPSMSGEGWGIAFAQYKNSHCYTAVIVNLLVDQESGAIQLKKAIIAADVGQIVNPDGLSNQLEGGFVQAASWTLTEAVHFNSTQILSQDWESYPILRADNVPVIEIVLIDRLEQPFLGSGEATQNPTPAAIGNAIFDAVGVRLREIPFNVLQQKHS